MNKKINGVLGQLMIHAEIQYTNSEGYSVHMYRCPPR